MEPQNPNLPSKRFKVAVAGILAVAIVGFFIWRFMKKSDEAPAEQPIISVRNGEGKAVGGDTSVSPSASEFLSDALPTPSVEPKPATTSTSNTPIALTQPKAPVKAAAPTIDSVSPSAFGDGDTVTIYGHGFTEENTVFLSSESTDTFTGIASKNGTSLTFTATLSPKRALAEGLAHLSPSLRALAIENIIKIQQAGSDKKDGWYVPVTIAVKNENGTSQKVPAEENVTKGI